MNNISLILTIIISSFIISVASAETRRITNFETIEKGFDSYYEGNKGTKVFEIYKNPDWIKFWGEHRGYKLPHKADPVITKPAPEIDFNHNYIVVVLDQPRGSSGYELTLQAIEFNDQFGNQPISLIIETKIPGPNTLNALMYSRPFHIVKIKKDK